jgi:hypothetical protein
MSAASDDQPVGSGSTGGAAPPRAHFAPPRTIATRFFVALLLVFDLRSKAAVFA